MPCTPQRCQCYLTGCADGAFWMIDPRYAALKVFPYFSLTVLISRGREGNKWVDKVSKSRQINRKWHTLERDNRNRNNSNPATRTTSEQAFVSLAPTFFKSQSKLSPLLLLSESDALRWGFDHGLPFRGLFVLSQRNMAFDCPFHVEYPTKDTPHFLLSAHLAYERRPFVWSVRVV